LTPIGRHVRWPSIAYRLTALGGSTSAVPRFGNDREDGRTGHAVLENDVAVNVDYPNRNRRLALDRLGLGAIAARSHTATWAP
jgi:hypothetical protein